MKVGGVFPEINVRVEVLTEDGFQWVDFVFSSVPFFGPSLRKVETLWTDEDISKALRDWDNAIVSSTIDEVREYLDEELKRLVSEDRDEWRIRK